ncbi:MAG TPA: radical SAM protein [Candidatus Hydrogenedentes bacterium]|nr:radical SAM protein [Candidatus Hydrogenedentota bacterium]HNT88101.1 radical SAM protein [Candidatus Hydrogenedentota bacterium]
MIAKDRFLLDPFTPAYLALGVHEAQSRAHTALRNLDACRACPRGCGVNRNGGEEGLCWTGRHARVASAFPHFGEEDCLRGSRGSGTIFFTPCNLRCVFCQNWDISQRRVGAEYPAELLADLMLELQRYGCHNVNFVTPSHVVPQIIEAVAAAIPKGLDVPIVYNTSAYDSVESLRLLDGLVDIYMPDFKYWDDETARDLSKAHDYPERARAAISEMHRQVGVLRFGPDGVARRGVLIRHLVMPGQVDQSAAIFRWIAEALSADTFINIMRQYRPANRVGAQRRYERINRRASAEEMAAAHAAARAAGLWRFDT